MWYETFETQIASSKMLQHCFIHRYVDNRLIIFPSQFKRNAILQLLISKSFYRHPIELEDVGDQHFLGFNVDIRDRSVQYNIPTEDWQHRRHASAGSNDLKLSSLSSRMYLMRRGTHPATLRNGAARALCEQYIKRGSCSQTVQKTAAKILSKLSTKEIKKCSSHQK